MVLVEGKMGEWGGDRQTGVQVGWKHNEGIVGMRDEGEE